MGKMKNCLKERLFLFQQFMLALVSASDALMLERLNQDFLSAVSLASQVAFMFNLFMTALFLGCLFWMLKLPVVYQHYKKYQWVKNMTAEEE